jgi:CelD/BcsL family acetyltransferase involved in cellulose biosynthesis
MHIKHSELRYKTITWEQMTPELMSTWHRMVESQTDLVNPFYQPEFFSIAHAVGRPVNVVILSQGSEIVGFFPFERHARKFARPVALCMNDFHGFILQPKFQVNVPELLRAAGLRTWEFDHVPTNQMPDNTSSVPISVSPYVNVSQGFENYRQALSQAGNKHLEKYLKDAKKLEQECGPIQFTLHNSQQHFVEKLLQWKQAQYQRTQALDIFQQRWAKELIQRILNTQTATFGGLLSTLEVGGECVAIHLGMRSQSVLHYWFPAYHATHAAVKFRPGLQLLIHMLQAMPNHGLTRLDLGKGTERYKLELATGQIALCEGIAGQSMWQNKLEETWKSCKQQLKQLASQLGMQVPLQLWQQYKLQRKYR